MAIFPDNLDLTNEPTLLKDSFNSLTNKECFELVKDNSEAQFITSTIREFIGRIKTMESFSIQNILKFKNSSACFYIGQCLFDAGLSFGGGRYDRSVRHVYEYYTIGFGQMKINLGETLLRAKTFGDKLVDHFTHSGIQLPDSEEFNDRFYLSSTEKQTLLKAFDANFVETINKYSGFTLFAKSDKMYLIFENQMEPQQSAIMEHVFTAFKFWMI